MRPALVSNTQPAALECDPSDRLPPNRQASATGSCSGRCWKMQGSALNHLSISSSPQRQQLHGCATTPPREVNV